MDLGLKGKVALVAAASQGLGKATAMGLAQEGARVAICSRDEEKLASAKQEIEQAAGAEILAVRADLTNVDDTKRLVAEVTGAYETIDILVNNAGGPPPGKFDDVTDEDWEWTFNLTLMSAVRLTREALPFMRAQGWGRIVNITSYSVKQPIDELLLSNSLRLSVIGWAKSMANQFAAQGILVNNVCPGWTRTDRVGTIFASRGEAEGRTAEEVEAEIASRIPMGRLGRPEEVADLVVFLASERAAYITGTSIQVDGGIVQGFY